MGKDTEVKEKIHLLDRSFYKFDDTEEAIIYSTNYGNSRKKNHMNIIFSKKDGSMTVEWHEGKKIASVLYISDISDKEFEFIYQEYIPQITYMEKIPKGDILVSCTNDKNGNKKISFAFKSKKKRHVRNGAYEDVKKETEDIYSKKYAYFKDLVTYLKHHRDLLIEEKKEEVKKTPKRKKEYNEVTNLDVPNSLFIYDRNYKLVGQKENKYFYEYSDPLTRVNGEYRLLEVNNENQNKYTINIHFRDVSDKFEDKYKLQIGKNLSGNITVEYETLKSTRLVVETPSQGYLDEDGNKRYQRVLENVKYKNKIEFINTSRFIDGKEVFSTERNTKFKYKANNRTQYLTQKKSSNYYVDEDDCSYYISGSEYAVLELMSSFADGIYNNIENSFQKVI